ncbi:glycosyltransferase family 4 protein [Cellulomonas shaoxiangyii]|uniref:Glycosyltransferase family 1 protein n=1 Tax=Cellulomonas shaoxiangyii TaxID=2566013 RepID=A0A4P7SHZ9_9CELL|nr:glycosyltransferase family 1 protein [Cellulomonas shaoxiangyii]QCB93147.1 glycosyltransferase family 1 protein [Cellulomonas shaoxiangyii]TGY84806.1 glycosyltransferase family 1 protein [Cellulomonas shaoxiangyii]
MRVLVDATAVPDDRGGVGRYVDDLVPALVRAGADVVVACRPSGVGALAASGARVHEVPDALDRRPVRLAWEQAGLPGLVRRVRPDVLHSPHYTVPVAAGVPAVVTLHDATFFSHPQWHLPVKARFFRAATRVAVGRADALVVPSAATRDAVLDAVPAAQRRADRFHVAWHGVDRDVFRPVDAAARARAAAAVGADRPAVVFLGTLEPRKNVVALVDGWVAACAGLPDPPPLVLAGARGWDQGVDAALARVPDGLRVLVPGYVPLDDLAGLLGGALVVAYPSLGEGFGLPVLEAMACGAAVLTTRRLSLPEVGGDAVAYTETDAASIGRALAALLADPARRERLGRAALERAAGFTWDASAAVHLEAFAAAAGRRSGRDRQPRSSRPSR